MRIGIAFATVGLVLGFGAKGCNQDRAPATDAFAGNSNPLTDPAAVNMAAVTTPLPRRDAQGRVLDERENGITGAQGEQYPEYGPAEQAGQQALGEADQPPPPMPEYVQPRATQPNTIWVPGYWGHSPKGYYWVPGAYVAPPRRGQLWTPGYWAANGPRYQFNPGYWGPHIGFYGGVPYGGGYPGRGFDGGYWRGNDFYYNQAVNQVDPILRYVYNQPEPVSYPYGRQSYNGGSGIQLLPIAAELLALHEQHERPVRFQYDIDRSAALDRAQFFDFNRGRPGRYFADDAYTLNHLVDERGRTILNERDEGFPGRGNAYGHYKNGKADGELSGRGDAYGNSKHEGRGRDHGEAENEDKGHGNGRGDQGRGHGNEGHGEGEGHGHGGEGHGKH